MRSLGVYVALTWMIGTVLICSQAAPVTEFFGPPQTIEGDSNVEYPDNVKNQSPKQVREMERFHRTYDNGTVEFKMALDNGHVQYQRISSKIVGGHSVQVYEGYISEQYKDGRYGTRYYAADENGYRSSPVIIENEPPKLPSSGPYSTRDVQDELMPPENEIQTETKTLTDNLVQIEKDLEEEQLKDLNLGTNNVQDNFVPTTETAILLQQENEKPSILEIPGGVRTELPLNYDLPSRTELPSTSEINIGIASDAPELSTHSTLSEGSGIGIVEEYTTEQPMFDTNQPIEEEEIVDIKITNEEPNTENPTEGSPETTLRTLLDDELTSPEIPSSVHNEDQLPSSSPLPELNGVKTDGQTSIVAQYPQEDAELESTTFLPTNDVMKNIGEEEVSTIASIDTDLNPHLSTLSPSSDVEVELSTKKALEDVTETTTEILLNTEIPTISTFINEPSSSPLPESNDESTVTQILLENDESQSTTEDVLKNFNESTDVSTEFPSTESNYNLPSSSLASEIENENTEKIELSTTESTKINTEAMESITNTDDEISHNNPNDRTSFVNEKEGRGFDFMSLFPFLHKNFTNSNDQGKSSSTEKIDSSEEVSIPTTTSANEITTESENISTTESDDQASTDQPLTTAVVVETSSEEIKGKSLENESTTEISEVANEERTTETEVMSTTEEIEVKTEVMSTTEEIEVKTEVMSTTEETKVKTGSDVELEFYPPVINF